MFLELRRTAAVAVTTLIGLGVAAVPATAAPAGPVVTRAALDPALVAGRGAAVAFLEQEAPTAPHTRCPPRRPAAPRCGSPRVNTSSSRCPRRPTR
jgi:hypothetical protein